MSQAALDNFRNLVASTSEFQTITGAANTNAAKAFVIKYGSDSAQPSVPSMAIATTNYRNRLEGYGPQHTYAESGVIRWTLWLAVPTGESITSDALRYDAIWTTVEGLVSGMKGKSGVSGAMQLNTVDVENVTRSAKNSERDYFKATGSCEWGVG